MCKVQVLSIHASYSAFSLLGEILQEKVFTNFKVKSLLFSLLVK